MKKIGFPRNKVTFIVLILIMLIVWRFDSSNFDREQNLIFYLFAVPLVVLVIWRNLSRKEFVPKAFETSSESNNLLPTSFFEIKSSPMHYSTSTVLLVTGFIAFLVATFVTVYFHSLCDFHFNCSALPRLFKYPFVIISAAFVGALLIWYFLFKRSKAYYENLGKMDEHFSGKEIVFTKEGLSVSPLLFQDENNPEFTFTESRRNKILKSMNYINLEWDEISEITVEKLDAENTTYRYCFKLRNNKIYKLERKPFFGKEATFLKLLYSYGHMKIILKDKLR